MLFQFKANDSLTFIFVFASLIFTSKSFASADSQRAEKVRYEFSKISMNLYARMCKSQTVAQEKKK